MSRRTLAKQNDIPKYVGECATKRKFIAERGVAKSSSPEIETAFVRHFTHSHLSEEVL